MDIGTGRFALPTQAGMANGEMDVQAFTGGQRKEGVEVSLAAICGVWGIFVLLM